MLRRKRVKPDSQHGGARRRGGRLGEALVDSGWALREHLIWRPLDALRSLRERVKSPFEGAAWKLRRAAWRVEDGTDLWAPATRALAAVGVVLIAAGAGAGGLLLAAPDRSEESGAATLAAAPAPTAVAPQVTVPEPKPKPPEPTLQGASPIFSSTGHAEEPRGSKGAGAKASGGKGSTKAAARDEAAEGEAVEAAEPTPLPTVLSSDGPAAVATTSSASKPGAVAGPKAVKVARQFAKAFVLYETGRVEGEVREAFAETATPALRRALLRRPPRQPANVEVPKAKVLNVVPGPSRAGVYTVSVSLLRVGLTSELRLDMEPGKGRRWQVTDVLG